MLGNVPHDVANAQPAPRMTNVTNKHTPSVSQAPITRTLQGGILTEMGDHTWFDRSPVSVNITDSVLQVNSHIRTQSKVSVRETTLSDSEKVITVSISTRLLDGKFSISTMNIFGISRDELVIALMNADISDATNPT